MKPTALFALFLVLAMLALTLTGSACTRNGVNCRKIATDPTLQAQVANEEAQMNEDISVLKLTPVVSIGFSFKF